MTKCYLCDSDQKVKDASLCVDCVRGFEILLEHNLFEEVDDDPESLASLRTFILRELNAGSVESSFVMLMYVVIRRKVKFTSVH
jgi:hypothetical protein